MMLLYAGLSVLAFAASYAGVARFRHWAENRGLLDQPNERSSHSVPTPRGGGVVIAATVLIMGSVLVFATGGIEERRAFLPYALGAALVASISWLDDIRSLPRWTRLIVHATAAGIAVAGLGSWRTLELPMAGTVVLGWSGIAVSLLWIVGLTNAFNFMDGIDGIAGGQAAVASAGWAVFSWQGGLPALGGLSLVVAAASLGFLIHNRPPARVFMGDVGSAFLGYTLAVLPLLYTSLRGEPAGSVALAIGILLVWPFVFDSCFTFLRRLKRGENVFEAHRSHLYQRLVAAGWSHLKVSLVYIGLAMWGLLLARMWCGRIAGGGAGPAALLLLLALCLWILVVTQERKAPSLVGSAPHSKERS